MYFPEILLHIINTSVFQLHALFVKAVIRCNNYIEQFRSTFNLSSFYIILDRTNIIPSLQPFRFSYALNLNEANVFSSSCSALASALILITAVWHNAGISSVLLWEHASLMMELFCGVPQGSVLGPAHVCFNCSQFAIFCEINVNFSSVPTKQNIWLSYPARRSWSL